MERSPAPPISHDLWLRLYRLDARCGIVMSRIETRTMSGPGPRIWLVRICLRTRIVDQIRSEHPQLREALTSAVQQAEQLGWHRQG